MVRDPGPVEPTTTSRRFASSMLATGTVCQTTHRKLSRVLPPIQVKRRASYLPCTVPTSGSITMPPPTTPSVVPSFGATL